MIDLDPSDPSCIYTAMKFASSQARRYDATPILTSDQPLYWKALTIIQSQPDGSDLKGMVFGFRGFHMQMSFLGSIGHLMAGSGLQALIEVAVHCQCCPTYVDWQGYLQSSSWPHVGRCCIEHHSCSEGIPHSVANQRDRLAQTGHSKY